MVRLWSGCDAAELLARYAVLVALGEHRAAGTPTSELVAIVADDLGRPTLGKWRGLATRLARHPANARYRVLPELDGLVLGTLLPLLDGPAGHRSLEGSLSLLRHRLAHGGGVTRSAAERLCTLWAPRIEALAAACEGLGVASPVGRDPDGRLRLLVGTSTSFVEAPHAIRDLEPVARLRPGQVAIARDDRAVLVWPLLLFSVPHSEDGTVLDETPTVQVYSRRDDAGLSLTPLASSAPESVETGEALTVFQALFDPPAARSGAAAAIRTVSRDFDAELAREAGRLVGREAELAHLRERITNKREGILWIGGPAGSGKSCFMAALVDGIRVSVGERTLLVPYRFRTDDPRCSRSAFLQHCVERLDRFLASDGPRRLPGSPLAALTALLDQLGDRRVVLVLDGIDEIGREDPSFVDAVILAGLRPGVLWICAGRPETSAGALLDPAFAEPAFEAGLPPLDASAVREMILEKIGPLRAVLLRQERDDGDAVVSPFVEKVTALARGLPLYIVYVIGDVLSRRLRALDAGERLPPSVEAWHLELLHRAGIGPLQQVVTPIVSLLAVVREPVDEEFLTTVLDHVDALPAARGEGVVLVRRALTALGSLVRRERTPRGRPAFGLFHDSLREHLVRSDDLRGSIELARRQLARFVQASPDGPTAEYVHRWAVAHLVDTGRTREAIAVLSSFERLALRFEVLGGEEGARTAMEDWDLVAASTELTAEAQEMRSFLALRGFLAARFEPLVSAATGLAVIASREQRAWLASAARRSLPGTASGVYEETGTIRATVPSACTSRIDAAGPVLAGDVRADGSAVVVGLRGGLVCEIDVRARRERASCRVDGDAIGIALDASGSRAVLVSSHGDAILWDLRARTTSSLTDGSRDVTAATIAGEHAWLGRSSGSLERLHLESRQPGALAILSGPVRAISRADEGRTIVAASEGGDVTVLDGNGLVLAGFHREARWSSVAISRDGRMVAAGATDGRVIAWEVASGATRYDARPVHDAVQSLAFSRDARMLWLGCTEAADARDVMERALVGVDLDGVDEGRRLEGHDDRVMFVRDAGGSLISGGTDATVRVWDVSRATSSSARGPLLYVGSVRCDGGRLIAGGDDGTARLLAPSDGHEETRIQAHQKPCWDARILSDGTIASAGADGEIRLHEPSGGLVRAWRAHTLQTVRLESSSDATMLIACGEEAPDIYSVKVLRAMDGAVLAERPGAAIAIVPGDELVVASQRDVSLVSLPTLSARWHGAHGEGAGLARVGGVLQVAASRDGRWIASSCTDGVITLRDRATGALIASWLAHRWTGSSGDWIRAIAFSEDGDHLVSGGDSGVVFLWDLPNATCRAVGFVPAWVTAITFLGDGLDIAVGGSDGYVRILRLAA